MDYLGVLSTKNNLIAAGVSAIVVFLATRAYYHYKNIYSFWNNKGVRGPKPTPIIGHLLQIFSQDRTKRQSIWQKEYGKVFGLYEGTKPVLMISDADVFYQICIKDFDIFPNHAEFKLMNEYQKNFLFSLRDNNWRRVRSTMTPTFTSGKIKRMFKLMDVCGDDLIHLFEEQLDDISRMPRNDSSKEINLKDLYSMYSMDAIATCCYGLKLERDSKTTNLKTAARRNEFVEMAMKMFDVDMKRFVLAAFVNEDLLRYFNYELMSRNKFEPLVARVKNLLKIRRDSGKTFDDYLQILINARVNDELELDEMDMKENHHAGLTRESLLQDQRRMKSGLENKSLSDLEVLSAAVFLLVVGLETTATLLTFCTYTLAFHQDIQERLHDEVKSIADYDQDKKSYSFEYEKLTGCQYLDSVICETLRMFPPAMITDRVANQDYRIEKYNIELKKDSKINFNLHAIMNSADYWHEPGKFDPDRFMPEHRDLIVPGSYCPFGVGPRHCIGMRFALTEAKLGLAKILMNFKFSPVEGTRFPPEAKLNFGLNGIKKPNVQFKVRSK